MRSQPSRSDPQDVIQRLLDEIVASGAETALQVAIYRDGDLVADAWAGKATGRAVDGATLFPIFSTGKGIAATAVNRLVQRGLLRYDDPIARWWPEFAAAGKADITLAHALSHTAGLPNLPARGTLAELCDWDGMCRTIAAMTPVHMPGAEQQYHAISQSWLIGEVARRADGRDFARIIREEVAEPLGVADDLFFGIHDGVVARVVDAESASPGSPAEEPADPLPAPVPWWVNPLERFINDRGIRSACIPASNGFMTARAIARHYAALVSAVDGVSLLDEETLAIATMPITPGRTYGMGYALWGPPEAPGAVFGHGGYGGSTGFADRRNRLAVGICKARMGGDASGRIQQVIKDVFTS